MSTPTPTTIDSLPTLTINALNTYSGSVDAVNDLLVIYQNSSTSTVNVNRNTLLNLSSAPVGLSDTQTLTNKTLTSPTISSPTFSGTTAGTFTIGGTVTFPSTVVSTTGVQALTNKTLTSPTINSPTITNASITADAITGYTTSNAGTIYGISITGGNTIGTALTLTSSLSINGGISSGSSGTIPSTLLYNPYKFSVYRNGLWTTAPGLGLITFDTNSPAPTAFDTSLNYSTSTGKFTAPITGFYWFGAAFNTVTAVAGFEYLVYLYKNGSQWYTGTTNQPDGTNGVSCAVSGLMQLSAGDYVQVYYTSDGVAGGTGSPWTYFNGFLVSAT